MVKNSNRGSKPGEKRGGRAKGTPNKVTVELRDQAKVYTEQALAVLVQVMTAGESDAARVAAANSVLDRGHGKATAIVEGNMAVALTILTGVPRAGS